LDVSTADVLLAKAWTVVEFVDETACAKTRREIVVDASASGHQTVFVSAGRRGLQLELAPADLVRLCSALLASLARDHGPG